MIQTCTLAHRLSIPTLEMKIYKTKNVNAMKLNCYVSLICA